MNTQRRDTAKADRFALCMGPTYAIATCNIQPKQLSIILLASPALMQLTLGSLNVSFVVNLNYYFIEVKQNMDAEI